MPRAYPLALAVLLGGCDGEQPESTDDAVAPTEYTYPPEAEAGGELDLDAAGVALDEMFASLRQMNAAPTIDGYDRLMAGSDTYCPTYYEQDGNTFWYATCTADSGATYDGYSFSYIYEDTDLFGDGNDWDAEVISGSADMSSPDGYRYHLGGTAYLAEASTVDGDSAVDLWYSSVAGAFYTDDPALSETWIAAPSSPTLSIYAASYIDYGLNLVFISGSAALSGEITAVSTDSLFIYTAVAGVYPCAEEPAGTLAFRDAHGAWYELTFDIDPDTLAVDDGACDGCGMVTHDGAVIGEICIDASTLVDWESTPW